MGGQKLTYSRTLKHNVTKITKKISKNAVPWVKLHTPSIFVAFGSMRFIEVQVHEEASMPGRFAPTPSGRMHIGNIYAMLGAWLSARSRDDGMILRIEDIDGPRVVPGAADAMMDDLRWLGLDWDGDPVFQSARHDMYEDALRHLRGLDVSDVLDSLGPADAGTASRPGKRPVAASPILVDSSAPLVYPCFCSRADIRAASAPQEGDRFMVYPGTCRRLAATDPAQTRERVLRGDRHSLRIAMPEPVADGTDAVISFEDEVFGMQRFDLPRDIGDTIIRRADGLFSYQLVVVVDDLTMRVDDIVRGRDLLRSNALQIYIRRALIASGFVDRPASDSSACDSATSGQTASAEHPHYAHLPLIDDAGGRRLAKRERSLDMGVLRAHGVTAERVIGYCAWLLGLQGSPSKTVPQPMSASEALSEFDWAKVRADTTDRCIDQRAFDEYFGL